MSPTMQDLINQEAADQVAIGTDHAAIVADEAKLAADNVTLTTDQGKASADASSFEADLTTTGPIIGLNSDGTTGTIYAAAGTVLQPNTPYPLASSVPVPAPPQPPAVVPSS